ncbi:hypothetical protein GW17_00025865 [Ensete ventricosum]|nr:hypothetical protein GW17_00025865 [Ensete ventricosum]
MESGRLGEQRTKGIDRKWENEEEEEEKEPLASIGEGSVAGRHRRPPSSSEPMCPPPARSVCHRKRSPPRPRPSPFDARAPSSWDETLTKTGSNRNGKRSHLSREKKPRVSCHLSRPYPKSYSKPCG